MKEDTFTEPQSDSQESPIMQIGGWYCAAEAGEGEGEGEGNEGEGEGNEGEGEGEGSGEGEGEGEGEPGIKLSKEALQQIGSMTGRLIKRHHDDNIAPYLGKQERYTAPENASAAEQFEADLVSDFLGGKATQAIARAVDIRQRAMDNLAKTNKIEIDKAITAKSEEPYYKDIYQDAKKIAHDKATKESYPPQAAADYGFTEAKLKHIEKIGTGGEGEGSLEHLSSGKRQTRKKSFTLPPKFRDACDKGIKEGTFKDEDEFIKYMSPQVKAQIGME